MRDGISNPGVAAKRADAGDTRRSNGAHIIGLNSAALHAHHDNDVRMCQMPALTEVCVYPPGTPWSFSILFFAQRWKV